MAKTVLQKGKCMTKNILADAALKKAMNLCARREYCSNDIRNKLDTWGLNEQYTENIISRLVKDNFINDNRYAEAFVKDRYWNNKWGKIKISAQLKAKKISSSSIESAMASIDEDQYRQTIREILISHRKFIKAKNQYDLKGKLLRFGLSRGFESHILYDVLNELE
jgi:regulatory protein